MRVFLMFISYEFKELESLAFGINQTNASFLIASGESLLKLQKVVHKCNKLENIVVIR